MLRKVLLFVFLGLDVAAITKLVVETVRERDETEFTHHSQTLETATTKVGIQQQTEKEQGNFVQLVCLTLKLPQFCVLTGGPKED